MKLSRLFTVGVFVWGCAAVASPAQALTMGKLRGVALLGQALNVTVAVQATAQEEVGTVCADADVFYGENPIDRSRIVVRMEQADGAVEARLRIQANAAVDEPVVTLYVRLGCRQQSTRKFVMLSDYASDVLASVPADMPKGVQELSGPTMVPVPATGRSEPRVAGVPPQPSEPGRLARSVAEGRKKQRAGVPLESTGGEATQADAPAAPRVVSRPLPALAAKPQQKPSPQRPLAVAKGPRLQLLPLDLTEAWEPSLKLSDSVLSLPLEEDPRRAEAAALWRALNATPQDVLRDSARVGALERELKTLQTQSLRTQQSLVELGGQLQRVHEERYSNPVLYVMAALLAVVAAFGTYWWRRQQSVFQPWWMAQPNAAHGTPEEPRPFHSIRQPSASPSPPTAALAPDSDLDIALGDSQPPMPVEDSHFVPSSAPPPSAFEGAPSGHSDFAHSVTGSLRAINTQEMVDVRQQADFFLALGQHDDAIRVLENGIGQSGDSNPLVFLDLVAVLHNLGRRDEYEQVRSTFNELYTGFIPAFADYSTTGDGLMGYPQVGERIARLWPTESAMEYIEHCLVRDITDTPDRGFELSAFRDLLMLHGIIGKIVVPNPQPGQCVAVERTLPFIASNSALRTTGTSG